MLLFTLAQKLTMHLGYHVTKNFQKSPNLVTLDV